MADQKARTRITLALGSEIRLHVDDNEPLILQVTDLRARGRGYYTVIGRDIGTGDYVDMTFNPPPKD